MMELRFEETTRECWRERLHREEKCRVDLEGVVPDVNDDVGRVASVQCSVLLKSKDLSEQGITVGGEVEAVVLYITENADAVASVRLTKEFSCTAETGETALAEAQAVLRVLRTEARVLNPRKLSVSAEIGCEISGYTREALTLSLLPGGEDAALLQGLEETTPMQATAAVCEKSFALTESFVFPAGKAAPLSIVSRELSFRMNEQSRIGSRLIVKGTMELALLYAAEGVSWPMRQVFSTPVSQILDMGADDAVCCTVRCVPTAAYLKISDSISGEKALEAEVHALLQATGRTQASLRCLSDAFSNVMPLRCTMRTLSAPRCGETERTLYTVEEPIAVSDDCADVLSVLPALSRDGAALTAELEILYRTKNGELAAARRSLAFKGETLPQDAQILSAELTRCELRSEGEGVSCAMTAALAWQRRCEEPVEAVAAVSLDEERPYDRAALPTVTLVRVQEESLWELARRYHSSVGAIESMNGTERYAGRMLLIPRA